MVWEPICFDKRSLMNELIELMGELIEWVHLSQLFVIRISNHKIYTKSAVIIKRVHHVYVLQWVEPSTTIHILRYNLHQLNNRSLLKQYNIPLRDMLIERHGRLNKICLPRNSTFKKKITKMNIKNENKRPLLTEHVGQTPIIENVQFNLLLVVT